MEYRKLTEDEVLLLRRNGCTAGDWSLVTVAPEATIAAPDGGTPDENAITLHKVRFGSNAALGPGCRIERSAISGCTLAAGCMVTDSTLADCAVGALTEIRNVERIENYTVGAGCRITDCGAITAAPYASMGCGTTVDVLDETGGRRITICPGLTAQVAYMAAFYRHNPPLVGAIETLVRNEVRTRASREGHVADGATIRYVTTIENVDIGPRAEISSAVQLRNGTLGPDAKVLENVSASDFILADHAVIGTSCVAKHVYLGQAASLGNSFVAHNSVIFANSTLECGETDALFAGPHTVSYHRSTLLIAAATSFFNAGSGTNQSNHYYCTGPIHHGILERGCKTGSSSYIKWPARIGQFSVIVGSHGDHPDTSSLPFSYLFGNNGETTVIPAANLRTCGVMRDVLKWRGRDRRSDGCPKLDNINYDEFTPYNAERMFQAINLLERFRDGEADPEDFRIHINPGHIPEGIRLYGVGLRYFFGLVLVDRILSLRDAGQPLSRLRGPEITGSTLFPWTGGTGKSGRDTGEGHIADGHTANGDIGDTDSPTGAGITDLTPWVDMAGMIAPRPVIDGLCGDISSGRFGTMAQLNAAVAAIHANYSLYRWIYVRSRLSRVFDIENDEPTVRDMIKIIGQWSEAARELCRLRTSDAMKDFSPEMSVGFGIDHPEFAALDHENSLGRPEENPHVRSIREHYALDSRNASAALDYLSRL